MVFKILTSVFTKLSGDFVSELYIKFYKGYKITPFLFISFYITSFSTLF